MAHPQYRLGSTKAALPSVTTILGRFKDPGGLIHWAWMEGSEGRDYRATRDKAANAGTIAHDMIEAEISGLDPMAPLSAAKRLEGGVELAKRAMRGYENYLRWRDQTKIQILHTEVSLVCDRFGGTLDAIGVAGDSLLLFDWKTSNAVYSDYLCQVAAYRHLWEHGRPNAARGGTAKEPPPRLGEPIQEIHLVRFDKEWGAFAHHSFPLELADMGWRLFSLLVEAYPLDKILKKAVG